MKIEIFRVSRRPPWPTWACLLVLSWLTLGGTTVWVGAAFDIPVRLCWFKRFTGIACPTCGFTRSMLSILQGRPLQAWLYNPLLCSLLLLFLLTTSVRLTLGKGVQITLTPTERNLAWFLAAILFAANWLYVIFCVG